MKITNRGLKISTEDPGGSTETRSSPPSSPSSSLTMELLRQPATSNRGRTTWRRRAEDASGRSRAAAERQPYCHGVRHGDNELPKDAGGKLLLNRTAAARTGTPPPSASFSPPPRPARRKKQTGELPEEQRPHLMWGDSRLRQHSRPPRTPGRGSKSVTAWSSAQAPRQEHIPPGYHHH
jgi:hypothetical protein